MSFLKNCFKPKCSIKIKGLNNQIDNIKSCTNKFASRGHDNSLWVKGSNNKISINSKNTLEKSKIVVHGDNNHIILSEGCGGILSIEILADNCFIEVGEKTGFTGAQICLWDNDSKVIFGKECIVAKETKFYCTDFHAIVDAQTKQPINQGHSIVIGNHVWVGEEVKVLKNTKVADNVIIGIGAVVSKDLEESYAVYAGAPAVLKKKNVDWQREKYDAAVNKFEGKEND